MPYILFSFRLLYFDWNTLEGAVIWVYGESFLGESDTEYKNSNGWARFSFFKEIAWSIKVSIYSGDKLGVRTFQNGDAASYTF
jgi:hypothetical protein